MAIGKSLRSHLIITRRTSILILIISTIISILIIKSLWRWRRRSNKATMASLSSCNTTDTTIHLIQLSSECIKVSIHALKLHHDCLESHNTSRRRRRSGGGWNGGGERICRLGLWPLRSKLSLALSNKHRFNGTHDSVERRIRNRDRRMAKHPCDT